MTMQSKILFAGTAIALAATAPAPMGSISAEWLAANYDQLTTKQARLEVTVGGAFSTGDTVNIELVDKDTLVVLASASRVCSPNLISGPGMTDSGPNNLNGTIIGAPSLSAANASVVGSAFGQSVSFAGTNGASADGIQIAHNSLFDGTTITVECWVKHNRTASVDSFLSLWGLAGTGSQDQWLMYIDASGFINARVNAATTNATVAGSTDLGTSVAHHVAMCYSAGTMRLLVDGASIGTATYTGALLTGIDPLYIGRTGSVSANAAACSVDEVRISNILRYTGAYTVPTAPFTSDANTIALYHLDSLTSMGTPSTNATFEIRTGLLTLPSTAQNVGVVVWNQNGARGNLLSAQIAGIG